MVEDSLMPTPLDPASLPRQVIALRGLLLQREAEHAAEQARQAAELIAARNGLQEQVLRNEQLKLRLARLLRARFGASSEKLRGAIDQLDLLLGDLEEQIAETAPAEAEPPAPSPPAATPRRQPVRKPLPASLPRDVVEHAAPCACPRCGGKLHALGEDVTEVLDYVPGAFRVIRHVRPKLSCRACESIAQAPAPSLPIRRGLAGPGLLAQVLVAKYCDHSPLHRQAEIYARDGIDLDRSTLADWVGQSARLLRPLVDALGAHVMAAERVHADDTTVPVLDPGRGTTRTGRLWCYVRDDRPFAGTAAPAVLYRYSPDRKGEHPRRTWLRSAASCRRTATPVMPDCMSAASPKRPAGRTRGASSSTCTRQPARRWRRTPCTGSRRCMRSKPRSAVSRRMFGWPSARRRARPCSLN